MNAAAACHEIPSCPGCYVDAFHGRYLSHKSRSPDHILILSHYHGDHYRNLPRDGKYQGPATIHCTPVTAALLRKVHLVPSNLVIEHAYGESWIFKPPANKKQAAGRKRKTPPTAETESEEGKDVKITFYDANHCPGATIILFELADGGRVLHTGDMRYHKKMKTYPLLREAALARKIDLVLLDTTYGNPKHDFVPQELAVDAIATQVEQLVGPHASSATSTLVLLSCYSIGKERVLWEASMRTNQLVYVNERKRCMLQCIDEENKQHVSSQIVQRCTDDAEKSDIHVIPMGLAGEMWPFFQPNYWACVDYAREQAKQYDKVVAFIPTGWAEATNWNKKNAISKRNCKGIDVEIRLISYSEHSSFSELQEFVKFLKPRKVIPTVFKDENDFRRIESRFKIDSHRAKQFFIDSMVSSPAKSVGNHGTASTANSSGEEEMSTSKDATRENVASLEAMGFHRLKAEAALKNNSGNLEAAINQLLEKKVKYCAADSSPIESTLKASSKLRAATKASSPSIKQFFQVKKKH